MTETTKDILAYIPHRSPFVMVDDVLEAQPERMVTSFMVLADNVLVHQGFLTVGGLVEHMAQSAAAGMKILAGTKNPSPTKGYIGALKSLTANVLPAIGQTVKTHVFILHSIMHARVIACKSYINDIEVATCEMKIFLLPA